LRVDPGTKKPSFRYAVTTHRAVDRGDCSSSDRARECALATTDEAGDGNLIDFDHLAAVPAPLSDHE